MKVAGVFLLSLLLLVSLRAVADKSDHDAVKRLKEAGDIVSLETLLADVRQRHPGRVLEIELEFEDGRYVYEIEMVDDKGEVREFYYDAKDGRFLKESSDEEPHEEGRHR